METQKTPTPLTVGSSALFGFVGEPSGSAQIVGRLVEIGDDENGQPMLLIHTTREAIIACRENMLFGNVVVTPAAQNDKGQLRREGSHEYTQD